MSIVKIATKNYLFKLASVLRLFKLSQFATRNHIRILCYHGIWLGPGQWSRFLFMSKACFSHRLKLLKSYKLPVLPLDEALVRLGEGSLPKNAVVITIDDGWYGTYKHMFPALKAAGMPFTIYAYTEPMVTQTPVFSVLLQYLFSISEKRILRLPNLLEQRNLTYFLDDEQSRQNALSDLSVHLLEKSESDAWREPLYYIADSLKVDVDNLIKNRVFGLMTLDELREIKEFGGKVELHTHSHILNFGNPSAIRKTINDNRFHLRKVVDDELHNFCYPSGVYKSSIFEQLTELGIRSATTTETGFVDKSTHALQLPRVVDGEVVSDLEFEAELKGFLEVKRRLVSLITSSARK